jgi:hypothetical protein
MRKTPDCRKADTVFHEMQSLKMTGQKKGLPDKRSMAERHETIINIKNKRQG